ncbi:MAG: lipocalin family protein [Nitrospirota bacterium]|nr:lipocalin family protein [Nitrospirota bacterium]
MTSSSIMAFALLATLVGCSSPPPIQTASQVDLERFMGDWYVIANIPTFIETEAFNAVESYRLNDDGTIATTFTFRKGGFEGKQKTYSPTGFVVDQESNAVWDMQFLWPFKADYRIVFVNSDYSQTIIGRVARDYVWIMARTPELSEADYHHLLKIIATQGYDLSKIQRVPQQWKVEQN